MFIIKDPLVPKNKEQVHYIYIWKGSVLGVFKNVALKDIDDLENKLYDANSKGDADRVAKVLTENGFEGVEMTLEEILEKIYPLLSEAYMRALTYPEAE